MTNNLKLPGFIFFFLFFAIGSFGQNVKGKVVDNVTGESLVDATVILRSVFNTFKTYSTKTGLNGSYVFKNIPDGSYNEIIEFVGYDSLKMPIEVRNNNILNNTVQLQLHVNQLNEVTVNSSGDKESDRSARNKMRSADNLVNVISARAIEISPDLTVGNVMQRAPGVSVIKNSSGDGQYAIIRGMADRYNYTTVNGIKIPSPDDKTRSVPLDIFPSDLLQKLEVVKSLTPSMEGDAIGGVTNMILKDAPRNLTVTFNAAGGYDNFFNTHTFTTFSHAGAPFQTPYEIHGPGYVPQPSDFNVNYLNYTTVQWPINAVFNGSVGTYLSKKFGFLVAVSYQHLYKGSSSLFYPPGGQPQPIPAPNTPVFAPLEYRIYNNLQSRLGTHLKLNYDFDQNNHLSFYVAFFQLDQTQHRNLEQGLANYLHISGQDYVFDRSLFERQIIWNNTLQGKHQINNKFSLDWSLVYSQAQSEIPVWVDQQYSDIVAYDHYGNLLSSQKNLQDFPFNFTHAKEIDRSVYLNGHYQLGSGFVISAGGLYRHKTKDNVFESYELYANNQPFTTIDAAYFERLKRVDTTDGLTYQSIENILAYYGQVAWNNQKWEVLAGLRIENTNHSYVSELSVYLPGKTGNYIYTDYLPSVNIKYKLSSDKDLRADYFRSISRPNYFEYIPVIKSGDFFDEQGNPAIKHVEANNYDLRYEQYFGAEDYFMAGAFYKELINPIEYALVQISTGQFVYQPQNFGNANNYGLELILTKHFRNFGFSGNYSYTKSAITTSKTVFAEDKNGNYIKYNTNETRPLQGQSDQIANLSLLYKSVKHGIDAQLSWVYTGQRIEYVSPYLNLDYWQRATAVLDFSIEVKTSRRVTLFGKVTNITNNPTILELHNTANGYYFNNINYPGQTSKNSIIVETDVFNQTFTLGVRFK